MFTSSIVRTLNKLRGKADSRKRAGRGPVPPPRPASNASSRKRTHSSTRPCVNTPSHKHTPKSSAPPPTATAQIAWSEPTQRCLEYARAHYAQLEKDASIMDGCHPTDTLRMNLHKQHLAQWNSRIRRLEKDLNRHVQYSTRYAATHDKGHPGEAVPTYVDINTVYINRCLHCGAKASMKINTSKSTQQCSQCFREEACYDVVHTTGDRPMTSKQNHYYPENHWNGALNYAQGMRCGAVPPEIIDKVNHQLQTVYQIQADERKQVPHSLIGTILKDLRYKKRNKQKVLCWCIITGQTPERLTIAEYLEADRYCKLYFQHIRPVIRSLNLSHRIDRKNLLSYDFLAYKIFELLSKQKPHCARHMKWYKLLKGDDKLWVQDLIWRGVCERTGWEFYPTS